MKSAYSFCLKLYVDKAPATSSKVVIPHKFWKFIWSKFFPPRLSFWLWRAIRDRLSSKDKLLQKRISISPTCVFWQGQSEFLLHLLSQCPIIKDFQLKLLPNIPKENEIDSVHAFWLCHWRNIYSVLNFRFSPYFVGLFGTLEIK